ncbi:hypothetical protein RhiirA4_474954 [Rhizophagus irregularis]|uniref:Uncharacterized protein n=1 Tax=Rhizophagus irregularis TaxID=588596 RepID=A0A2I1H9D5_9GLOM|nr:hypothetical protein RhiirA4_474954 [Rhizophagus irregularis]
MIELIELHVNGENLDVTRVAFHVVVIVVTVLAFQRNVQAVKIKESFHFIQILNCGLNSSCKNHIDSGTVTLGLS